MDSLRKYLEKNLNISKEEAKLIEKTVTQYIMLKEIHPVLDDFGYALINLYPFTFQKYLASNIDSFTPEKLVTLLLYKLKVIDINQYEKLSKLERDNRNNPQFYLEIYNNVKKMILSGGIEF